MAIVIGYSGPGRGRSVSGALDVSAAALSPREYEYIWLRAKGLTMDEMAIEMDCSVSTVKTYCEKVHRKLRVNSTVDALRALGWLVVPEGRD